MSLVGPAPWGFRLQGGKDFNVPLSISRVSAFASFLHVGICYTVANPQPSDEAINYRYWGSTCPVAWGTVGGEGRIERGK